VRHDHTGATTPLADGEAGFENARVAEQPLPTRFVMLAEADVGTGASEHSGG
jgi:hypothetical protein